jgi:hypothetical protein
MVSAVSKKRCYSRVLGLGLPEEDARGDTPAVQFEPFAAKVLGQTAISAARSSNLVSRG